MTEVAVQAETHHARPPRVPFNRTDVLVLAGALGVAALCAAVATLGGLHRLNRHDGRRRSRG